ncbi:MAG TPA: glycoside hydrolase family 5 protein [Opitutaceae bacterium]|nr:glycoside hydrolase family 5 protein [Opitutaceae bacterium]
MSYKTILSFCAALGLGVVISTASALAASAQFAHVEGKELVGADGKPLLLRGINLGNWMVAEGYMFDLKRVASAEQINTLISECLGDMGAAKFWREWRANYITQKDIHLIKSLGMNSVRIPLNWRLFITEDASHRMEGDGWELLENAVSWCKAEGLYVIFDLHCAPGGQTGDNIDDSRGRPLLFEDEEAQKLTIALWRELARRYADEPLVLGYDLLNEPIAPYFDIEALNPKLAPLYSRITKSVREVDRNHVIILGGAQWDTNLPAARIEGDDNILYTFHLYWSPPTDASIGKYLEFREKYNVPLWLGESGENTDEWVSQFRALLEKHNIGWCFWPYKKLNKNSCFVTVAVPPHWDAINAYAAEPKKDFKEIRETLPPLPVAQEAFKGLLEAIKLENAKVNRGYVEALGGQ